MSSEPLPSTMQAWQYGTITNGIENCIKLDPSVPLPTPRSDQHLVRILATALNPVDYKPAEIPFINRFVISKPATPGIDFVGRMVRPAAGSLLKPDQLVFGMGSTTPFAGGCLKEYHAMPALGVVAVPEGVDKIDAATIGVAGQTAYQSIVPSIKAGARVFINGGSGGAGIFGIQIAKIVGAHVTTCCSTANVELCKSLGADEVIDYKQGPVLDALKKLKPFDHVVDNVAADYDLYWRAHEYTTDSALFVEVASGPTLNYVWFATRARLLPSFLGGGRRKFRGFLTETKPEQLEQIANWMAEGRLRTVIDEKFYFQDAPAAFRKLKTGRAKGKIVIEGPAETSKS